MAVISQLFSRLLLLLGSKFRGRDISVTSSVAQTAYKNLTGSSSYLKKKKLKCSFVETAYSKWKDPSPISLLTLQIDSYYPAFYNAATHRC